MTSASLGQRAPLHVVVSGASGLIGSALLRRLGVQGHRVSRLVRRAAGPGEIFWNPAAGVLDPAPLEGVDAVVHLSGENVGARWTAGRRIRIRASRVASTRLLSETLAGLKRPPQVLVSASAVGIYGDRGDEILTEQSPLGSPDRDFLASVTQDWEAAAGPARDRGIRVVHPRFGVVLSPRGGALKKMLLPFRLGLGGRLGSGKQWMSWILLDDAAEAVQWGLLSDSLEGAINVTAPEPCTNREFTDTLARVLSRPAPIAVPEVALRLALGEMATGTILASCRVLPVKLLQAGYTFRHVGLESALRHLLQPDGRDNFRA